MLGRAPYGNPWLLAQVDPLLFGQTAPLSARHEAIEPLIRYASAHVARGGRLRDVTRHVLGLFNGLPGARHWRRCLSQATELAGNDPMLIARAAAAVSVS